MELELAGQVALVTGSSRGLGLAIARALAAEGCTVAINGRDAASVAAAAALIPNGVAVAGDMSQPDDARRVVMATVAAKSRLDILVCNVGGGRSVPPGRETFDEWQRVFALNLWSTTNAVEAAREPLKNSRGAIVCVSSICGLEVVPGAPVTYSVAKAAINAYTRGMARPLGVDGVRINGVAPGNLLFDGSVWAGKRAADPLGVEAMLAREVALNRLGSDSEIASLVAYLASPRASFVTGSVWTADGGQVRS